MLRFRHRLVYVSSNDSIRSSAGWWFTAQPTQPICPACRYFYGRTPHYDNSGSYRQQQQKESFKDTSRPPPSLPPACPTPAAAMTWGGRGASSGGGWQGHHTTHRGRGDGGYAQVSRGRGRSSGYYNSTITTADRVTGGVQYSSSSIPSLHGQATAGAVKAEEAELISAASKPCRSFWSQRVRHVPARELKHQHLLARTADKRSRFAVRRRLRDDGALSNLFPVTFPDATAATQPHASGKKHGPYLYIYEMYVTRCVRPRDSTGPSNVRPPSTARASGAKKGKLSGAHVTFQAQPQQLTSDGKNINNNISSGSSSSSSSSVTPTGTAAVVSETLSKGLEERRVPAGRSWRAIQRYLRHRYAAAAADLLPPLVQVENRVYTAGPLPTDALQLPKTYFDVGWTKAELRLVGRRRYTELPAKELQMVLNKIALEVARETQRRHESRRGGTGGCGGAAASQGDAEDLGALEVVREKTGKVVCTMQGVSSSGVRVYRGIYVQAVFIDHAAALTYGDDSSNNNNSSSNSKARSLLTPAQEPPLVLHTRHLAETPVGLTDPNHSIHFRVDAFLRAFTYRGTPVESYRISDASGSVLASVWAPASPQSLRVGALYAAAPVRIREFAERGNARMIELPSGTVPQLLSAPDAPPMTTATSATTAAMPAATAAEPADAAASSAPPSHLPGHVSFKIDTKGTIASETSLWEEVLQHYGPGPYDEATQQRIQKALLNMPVVVSYSLRQGVVREVRFDGAALLAAATASDNLLEASAQTASANPTPLSSHPAPLTGTRVPMLGAREPRLLPLLPYLDAQQPCAVLADHTIMPLQVLHCCFDPAMRAWQEVGVAVLSLMPTERMELLNFVQRLLSRGLRRWGIEVACRPWRTKALSLLPPPMKYVAPVTSLSSSLPPPPPALAAATGAVDGRAARALTFPSTMVVLGIAGPRCTADQAQRISLTAQHAARYFRTSLVACVADESGGLQYVHDHLMNQSHPQQQEHQQQQHQRCVTVSSSLRDVNSCLVVITTEPDTRATRWLKVECLSRGIHLITLPPSSSPKMLNMMCAGLRRQITTQFEVDPLRGVNLRAEVPVLGQRSVLIIGVDTCHTNTHSIGTIVGILSTPRGNHLLSHFWTHDARGREASHVALHFKNMLATALTRYGGVDEVIVFQDGNVFSELAGVKDELAAQVPGCGLTFLCLHKRCNVRFIHASSHPSSSSAATATTSAVTVVPTGRVGDDTVVSHGDGMTCGFHNVTKGVVIAALAPIPLDYDVAAPSFYLQTHESAMSTARAVQYTVHHISPTLDVTDVQQMANVMADVLTPRATKLPMPTRCAHRLADRAERLLDAVPQFTGEMIPWPLSDRLWFL